MNPTDDGKSGDKRSSIDRRRAIAVTIGGVAMTISLPSRWLKPLVDAVIVPAHAAASAPATTPKPTSTTAAPTTTPTPTTTPGA